MEHTLRTTYPRLCYNFMAVWRRVLQPILRTNTLAYATTLKLFGISEGCCPHKCAPTILLAAIKLWHKRGYVVRNFCAPTIPRLCHNFMAVWRSVGAHFLRTTSLAYATTLWLFREGWSTLVADNIPSLMPQLCGIWRGWSTLVADNIPRLCHNFMAV